METCHVLVICRGLFRLYSDHEFPPHPTPSIVGLEDVDPPKKARPWEPGVGGALRWGACTPPGGPMRR